MKYQCPICNSKNIIKAGINYQSKRQKLLCKDCGTIFQDGFVGKKVLE